MEGKKTWAVRRPHVSLIHLKPEGSQTDQFGEVEMLKKPFWRLVGLGVVAVLIFDTAASFASLWFGFPYEDAVFGSILVYSTIGYLGFRGAGLKSSVGAALLVELVDVTLGWGISWWIGPGALTEGQWMAPLIAVAIVFVFIFSVFCACVGAGVARVMHGPRQVGVPPTTGANLG